MKIKKLNHTPIRYAEFFDLGDQHCSISESSLATDDAIWLGDIATGRMLLNRKMVKELLPLLEHFAKTGRLPEK